MTQDERRLAELIQEYEQLRSRDPETDLGVLRERAGAQWPQLLEVVEELEFWMQVLGGGSD